MTHACATQWPARCFDGDTNTGVITGARRLRHLLAEATATFYEVLDRYALADITGNQPVRERILRRPLA